MQRFHLEFCGKPSTNAIVFHLHGYSAFDNMWDKETFKNYIRGIQGATNIIVTWPSEHFKNVVNVNKYQIIEDLFLRKNQNGYALKEAVESPLKIPGHFAKIRKRADELSHHLFSAMQNFLEINTLTNIPVYIIAHSLGARMTSFALAHQIRPLPFQLKEVALLGAAIGNEEVNWQKALQPIEKRLVNLYSPSDKILLIDLKTSKPIGRYGILDHSLESLHQIKLDWGHSDYWPNLQTVLQKLGWNVTYQAQVLPSKVSAVALAQHDLALSEILHKATPTERKLIAYFLAKHRSTQINPDETDVTTLVQAIHYMGGDAVRNYTRGYGVPYAEIVEDIAEVNDVSTVQNMVLELWEQAIFKQLLPNMTPGKQWETFVKEVEKLYENLSGMKGFTQRKNRADGSIAQVLNYAVDAVLEISGPAYGLLAAIVCVVTWVRAR